MFNMFHFARFLKVQTYTFNEALFRIYKTVFPKNNSHEIFARSKADVTPLVKFSWKSSRNVIFWWDSGLEKSDRNSWTKATNYGEFPLTEWSAAVGGQIEAQRSQIIVTEPGLSLSHTQEVKILSIPRLEMRDCKSYVELLLLDIPLSLCLPKICRMQFPHHSYPLPAINLISQWNGWKTQRIE